MKRILRCSIFLMITSQIFAGTVYYVDGTNGNNAYPGTESLPWQTIQKAANTMVAGDMVIVKAGTYDERVTINTSGSAGNLITYQAQSGAIVQCNGFTLSGDYIKVDGFKIVAASCTFQYGEGIYCTSDYCEIVNNYCYGCWRGGVQLTDTTNYCTVKGNEVEYCAGYCGITVAGYNHTVEDNEIHDQRLSNDPTCSFNDKDGIWFFGSGHVFRGNYIHNITHDTDPTGGQHIDAFQTWNSGSGGWTAANNCTFERNLIELNNSSPANEAYGQAGPNGWMMQDCGSLVIKNNLVLCPKGVHAWGNGPVKVLNNTFIIDPSLEWPNSLSPTAVFSGMSDLEVKNNIVIDTMWHYFYTWGSPDIDNNLTWNHDGSQGSSPGTWHADPKFVDYSSQYDSSCDFHLQSDSPCINVGANLSGTVDDDYDGNSRPQGTGYDIGAYECVIKFNLTIETSTNGTTDPAPGSYDYDSGTQVSVQATANSGYQFSGWSGDASGTTNPITITMDSDKSIAANFRKIFTPVDETAIKRGCFIVTAAYGSPLHPYVKILQDFRDKYLMPIKFGREIVNFYYKYSPFVANLIAKQKALKFAVRINLLPLVIFSYSMVHFGPIISGIMFVSILVLQIFLILFLRRKTIKRS